MKRALPIVAVGYFIGLAGAGLAGEAVAARADDSSSSNSPYIDSLRKEMKNSGPSTDSEGYTQKRQNEIREKDKASSQSSEGYTEQLKKEMAPAKTDSTSYIDRQRALMEPKKDGGAIEAVKEGRSDLHARIEGDIHNGVGFRIGTSWNRSTTAPGIQGTDFGTIYSSEFLPDVAIFYEYQPWHSETWGSLGFLMSTGVGIYKGAGVFQFQLQYPDGSGPIQGPSHVQTQLFEVPITLGLTYRLNLLRYLRPFITVGPTLVTVYEQRNDGGDAHWADARGFSGQLGLSILLDGVSKEARWQLYDSMRIKHYYLTLEFDQINAFGPVTITSSGATAGFTFEF